MSDKKQSNNNDANISKNVRWDTPKVDPKAGSTIPKPPTSLNPDRKGKE
ncbi:hypothetical protein [Flavobacterium sp. CS20]|nr:hypothetical protein [Flavobacterium sp. CS20]QTY28159.1 hypothetical protein IGB25_06650 [Flavobacterium sp. CS20]